ncbi:tubulin polyglutamylase TTLL5 isoform X2 [Rhinoderma darwinii]|uniref:tubulin polyglutamylase TTLL5 isoform X2 n=1 Tax=Rhinoderma darwinii TaxID=43563 RepID=UPI003F66259F
MPSQVTRAPADPLCPAEEDYGESSCITWTGGSRRLLVLVFHAESVLSEDPSLRAVGERFRLAYKMVRTDSRLVRSILSAHGFQEVNANSNNFNLMWTGSHVKPHLMRSLASFQKVNHFPRSYELTRKDRLYKNVQRMQQTYNVRNFNLLPQTYLLPGEYQEFCNAFSKDRGPWIVKPVASSRGRGVYLVNSPSQISMEENLLVSRYISNPLLIDGFKFDVRLYVLITSYDPLVIYLYEEGLTSCDNPEVEDYGNKWSMSAMLRYLKQEGKDTAALMSQVEDLIIKTVIAGELPIATACKSFLAHRGNCFELYGFDVLIDGNLRPWLLEVNLSPSLACDAPLDMKVKASMISDMLTLIGVECQDPQQGPGRGAVTLNEKRIHRAQRPLSASDIDSRLQLGSREKNGRSFVLGLSTEEVKVLRRLQDEEARRGGFVRVFPRHDTWSLYSSFLEHKTSLNHMLATHLFPNRSMTNGTCEPRPKLHAALYERKLVSLQLRRARRQGLTRTAALPRPANSGVQEEDEEDPTEHEEQEEVQQQNSPAADSQTSPQVRIMELLQGGANLSKVQARSAFSAYLQRVQSRLQSERDTERSSPKDGEQMELVRRFLDRAAANLQQSVCLKLPSRSASHPEKRRLLAKQLRDFIYLYDQETQQVNGEDLGVTPLDFEAFLAKASERHLEDVLTFYTHKNKSASVFLGGSQGVDTGGKEAEMPPSLISCASGQSVVCVLSEGATAPPSNQRSRPPSARSVLHLPSTAAQSSSCGTWARPVPPARSWTLGSLSSFQSAAQIYSQRLTRAASAQPNVLRTRCGSAGAAKELEDPYHVGAVTASLQRLAERQATRQNSSHLRPLTQQVSRMNIGSSALARLGLRLTRAVHTEGKPQKLEKSSDGTEPPSTSASPISAERSHVSDKIPVSVRPAGVQHGVLQPTPPTTNQLSAPRTVRVMSSDGQKNPGGPLSSDPAPHRSAVIAGCPDGAQIVFARSRPPVPRPGLSSKVQMGGVVCPT